MGRLLFRYFGFILKAISFLFRMLPQFFLYFLLDVASVIPTRIGVLVRYVLVGALVDSIGNNVYVGRFVVFKNISNFKIGSNVSIHDYCYIDALGGIEIGNDISIAHRCSIISFDHSCSDVNTPIKYNALKLSPVVIASDVWIGAGVSVLKGVTINNRCIVAAGSVVVKSLDSNALYAGVPAKKVKGI